MGVKYHMNANIRTAEEVAKNLVYPNKTDNKENTAKKEERREVYEEVKEESFNTTPLLCVMDGSIEYPTIATGVVESACGHVG